MGKKKDYIPKRDTELLVFHDNLKSQVGGFVGQAGITANDVTQINTDNADLHTANADAVTAEHVSKAKFATKGTVGKRVTGNTRKFSNRVKAATGYTVAIGQQLGIIGEEDTTDLSTASPTLTVTLDATGHAVIAFNKSISDGVQIFSKRGSATSFSLLAVDTESPYVDNRANLAPGPESREYRAHYIVSDTPIGNLSAIYPFIVPTLVNPPPPPPGP